MTPEYERTIEEGFKLTDRAWAILGLVVAEWESDPTSVQCFDLRIIEEARYIVRRREQIRHIIDPFGGPSP